MSDIINLTLDNSGEPFILTISDALPPQSLTLSPIVSNIDLNFGVTAGVGPMGQSGFSGYSGQDGANGNDGSQGVPGNDGASGISGYSGFSGRSGYSGYSGITGSTGLSGTSGYSGFSGRSGFSGYSGTNGSVGSIGTSGYSGFSGVNGTTGTTGTSGYSGYSGITGSNGSNGASGTSGYSGFSGIGSSGFSGYSGTSSSIGGSDTQIQYNNAGSLAGSSNHTWDNTNNTDIVTTGTTAATVYSAFVAQNTAAATAGNQQYGGFYFSKGAGWKTASTAGSQAAQFRWGTIPVQGVAQPLATWVLQSSINGAAFGTAFSVSDTGLATFANAGVAGTLTIQQTATNTTVFSFTGISNNITAGPSNRLFVNFPGVAFQTCIGAGMTPSQSAYIEAPASTTAISHMKFTAGVAPTSPANGQFWFDGTNYKAMVGGVVKTFTLT